MSTGEAGIVRSLAYREGGTPTPGPVHRLYRLLTPSQGWASFVLLVAMLVVVGESVTTADWVDTPGLNRVLFFGLLAGMLLAKVRAPALFLLLTGLVLGFVVVVWQVSSLTEPNSLTVQAREIWDRLDIWYEAAGSGGISTDLLPFSLAIVASAWLLGLVCAWFVFRSNNVWIPVVLGGTAILTNLSFLPDQFVVRFFIFTFFAMLLVVWMATVQRRQVWNRSGIGFPATGSWLTLQSAVWFSIFVMIVAAVLPMEPFRSGPLKAVWLVGRTPVKNLEDEFARLFGEIPTRKGIVGRFFGDTLPFLSRVSLSDDVAFWASTEFPSYWLSQTYSFYTHRGWIAGETNTVEVGPEVLPPSQGNSRSLESVTQTVIPVSGMQELLVGGGLDWISRDALVKTLAPMQFVIDIDDPGGDQYLPEDVKRTAEELRNNLGTPPEDLVESVISRGLPQDLVLLSVTMAQDEQGVSVPMRVVLERKEPTTPDVVSVEFTDDLADQEQYRMVSLVSVAKYEDLVDTGTEYSGYVRDHYLQLPADMPSRVVDLAHELTGGRETPIDKALAIQEYLRSPEFEYSRKLTPLKDTDGVEHFLFESKTGFSDYFASAMTVLLRAVGVPSRMAVGFAPGQVDDVSGLRYIKESDSHGWTQVYFPGYGWIDFEPTPEWETPVRQLPPVEEPDRDITLGGGVFKDEFLDDPLDILDPEDLALFPNTGMSKTPFDYWGLVIKIAIGTGAAGMTWLTLLMVWNIGLGKTTPGEKLYAKMSRLGAMAGLKRRAHQTPLEYAASLGRALPSIAPEALLIGRSYGADRYGKQESDQQDLSVLEQAWAAIRKSLAMRALRRLISVGPRPASHDA